MSTKIYNGFRFTFTDLNRVHRELMKFKKELQPLVVQKFTVEVATRATQVVDKRAMGVNVSLDGSSPFYHAWREVEDEQLEVERTKQRNTLVDFSFEMVVIPIPRRKKVLGLHYTEQRDFRKLWMDKPFVKDYHYQNQTDQPEDVSNEEWDQRESDWEVALPGYEPPSMCGFSTTLVMGRGGVIPDIADVIAAQPKRPSRILTQARDVVFQGWAKGRNIDAQQLFRHYCAFEEWEKTGEGKKKLSEAKKEVGKILPRRISKKHLMDKGV